MGGFVFFFNDTLTFSEAQQKLNGLYDEGLLGKEFLSIVYEVMLYNQNLQAGVILNYEFLYNNAGKIDKTISSDLFYHSRYHTDFYQYSHSTITVLLI